MEQTEFDLLEYGRSGLREEANALLTAAARIDEEFKTAVDLVHHCQGKVILTGVGKSGIVAHKIAATMACAGIPAFFLHAAESFHGDLGAVQQQDVVIFISNSGNSDEIKRGLVQALKRIGVKLIAFTAKPDSILGQHSDAILDITVEKEICPLGLSATTSTTLTMAMGDILAMAVMKKKGTTLADFGFLHQGGARGSELKGEG